MPLSSEVEELLKKIISGEKTVAPEQRAVLNAAIQKAEGTGIKGVPNAAKPVVKGPMEVSDLAREGQLTPKQNIIQKLTTGDDYKQKLRNMGMGGAAGAVGGAALMSGGNDASAAEMPMSQAPQSNNIPVNQELSQPMSDPVSQVNQDSQPSPSVMDQLKQGGSNAIQTAKGYYDRLPAGVKDTVSGASQLASAPAAAMRNAAYAAQTGGDVGNAAYKGIVDPDQAKTGADIADATGISDNYPNVKAALATAADFADPMDVAQELNPAEYSKIKALLGK